MRCLVLGDLHIGGLSTLFGDKGLDYNMWAVKYAIEYCKEESIDVLIQTGDVFDSPYPSQHEQKRLMSLLCNCGLKVFMILGNHDYDVESNGLELTQWISELVDGPKIITKPTSIKIEGTRCWFSPFPYTKEPEKSSLCFGHFDIPGAKRDNGFSIKGKPFKRSMNWILGHLHTFQHYDKAIFVGTPYQTNFGEKTNKYMLDVSCFNGKLDWKAVPIDPPFKLEKKILEHQDQVDFKLEKNTYYWVFVKSDLKIPEDYLTLRPSILKFDGYTSRSQLQALEMDSVKYDSRVQINPTYKLKEFLIGKGYSPKQVKKAIRIVKKELE